MSGPKRDEAAEAVAIGQLHELIAHYGTRRSASEAAGMASNMAGDILSGRKCCGPASRARIAAAHALLATAKRCLVCGRPTIGEATICRRADCVRRQASKERTAKARREATEVPVLAPERVVRTSTERPAQIAHTHGRASASWLGVGGFPEPVVRDVSSIRVPAPNAQTGTIGRAA